jgi:hypothetical protein
MKSTDISRRFGTSWDPTNTNTIFEWVNIAALNIQCHEYNIQRLRAIIRKQTILGLVFSTLSGTLSVGQFGVSENSSSALAIRILFMVFSFSIAIVTGGIKIYQIQERLEQSIKLKHDWIAFSANIAGELKLPIALRHDAVHIINSNKDAFLELMKANIELPADIQTRVSNELVRIDNNNVVQRQNIISLPQMMVNICIEDVPKMENPMRSLRARNVESIRVGKQPSVLPTSVVDSVHMIVEPPSIPGSVDETSPPPAHRA